MRSPRLLMAPREDDEDDGAAGRTGRTRTPRDPDARSLDEVTSEHVLRVLARHDDNATAAARVLGVSRTTLWRMLKRWGVKRPAAQGK